MMLILFQVEKLIQELNRELNDLRSQHKKAIAANSGEMNVNSDILTDLYDASLQKYDLLYKNYSDLNGRHADLKAEHSSLCCQLEARNDIHKQVCCKLLNLCLFVDFFGCLRPISHCGRFLWSHSGCQREDMVLNALFVDIPRLLQIRLVHWLFF